MWFRNYCTFRLTQPLQLTQEALEEALKTKLARPCANQELSTYGFVSPLATKELERTDASPSLSHWSQNAFLIAARSETKKLPPSVVNDELDLKVKAIEAEQMRKVYKKERNQIKDEIIQGLLPRAFINRKITFGYVDLESGLVFVNTASPKNAEDLLSTLREALGSLPVRPLTVKIAPSATMTEWIKHKQAAEGFTALGNCTLQDTQEDGGKVECKSQDLTSDEVANHIAAGKIVTKLDLAFEDKMSFSLTEKMVLKSVRFEDLIQDQAAKDGEADEKAFLDACFTLMVLNNRLFMPKLLDSLGGEDIPQGI